MRAAMLMQQTFRYRAIWISDVHLGTKGCRAELLLDFLRHTESETLYLVGDIIDGWRLKSAWYWPQSHNDVVQKLLRKARKGTRVIYIPGNHDEFARPFVNHQFGGIDVRPNVMHRTADGRRLLVIHGDELDAVIQSAKWLALLGDWAYRLALVANVYFNAVRRALGYDYWSLSAYLKYKVKNAVAHIGRFEASAAQYARERGADGVVCGHIHHPEMRDVNGTLYANDGDWVESCTALVEHEDGRLELLHWRAPLALQRPEAPVSDRVAAPAAAARV
ncbi:MAG: UDP-2,3-diacylglucosamine diphosphatase [Alphaproteobacteria bacterium]|nr:UDP-2,3-diacylglucosamine diphosphatase [Alphaproteobacteria bacterium]MCB9929668.1 UDP-2,3-diacylglucosamine diphosphatase [Alphaproteobacteria bacterium]